MLKPVYLRSFEREIEKAKKHGLDMSKIKNLIEDLINGKPLAFLDFGFCRQGAIYSFRFFIRNLHKKRPFEIDP